MKAPYGLMEESRKRNLILRTWQSKSVHLRVLENSNSGELIISDRIFS